MVNQRKYLLFWIGVLILSIFMAVSCEKEPYFDPNCGVIDFSIHSGNTWAVGYKWNDGERDTIIWHFDPVSKPGDTICRLLPVDWDELNCYKP